MDDFKNFIVGAYATSPTIFNWNEDKEKEYILEFKKKLNIRGLELPFFGELHGRNEDFFIELLNSCWEYVLTCLPGTMKSLEVNPYFGLASDNEEGRREAIDFLKKAHKTVEKLNKYFGEKKVISVVLTTSPSLKVDKVQSSVSSLVKSLNELLNWNWFGAKLVIEHCDSGRKNNPVKGFLSLDEEIDALETVNKNISNPIGLTINWARSVIEFRSEMGPIEHVNKCFNKGLLSGIMFSGTSPDSKLYGSWSDLHLPIAKEKGIEYFEETSLLTAQNIKNTLSQCKVGLLDYIGIKVLSMPIEGSSLDQRIGFNKDTMKILNNVITDISNEYND